MGRLASRLRLIGSVFRHPVPVGATIAAILVPSARVRANLFVVVARWGPENLVRAWSAGRWGLGIPISFSGLELVLLRFPELGFETAYAAVSRLAATREGDGRGPGEAKQFRNSAVSRNEQVEVWLKTREIGLALSILKRALSKKDFAVVTMVSESIMRGSQGVDEATALRTARLLWAKGYQRSALDWAEVQLHNSDETLPIAVAIWLAKSRNLCGQWTETLSDWSRTEQRLVHSSGNQYSRYLREVAQAAESLSTWHLTCHWDESRETLAFVQIYNGRASRPSTTDLYRKAVLANPGSVGALVELARCERSRGDFRSARELLARVLRLLHTAPTDSRLRFYHTVVFELHHMAENSALERDPMWDVSIIDSNLATPVDGQIAVGCFKSEIAFSGLRLSGFVADPHASSVQLCIDGSPIKTINLPTPSSPLESAQRRRVREFRFLLHREVLEAIVDRVEISFRTDTGEALLAPSQARSQSVVLEKRTSNLSAPARFLQVTKKGRVSAPEGKAQASAHLELYLAARDAFAQLFGIDLMVGYGTLLGAVRSGAAIPGDDDFDAVYVSSGVDPSSVRLESHQLIVDLVNEGFSVSVNRRGVPFRLHLRGPNWREVHIDIRAVWFQDGRAFARNYLSFPSTVPDWLPPSIVEFDGRRVLAPNKPEVFLRGHYGDNWRTPDSGFRYHSDFQPPGVSKVLRSMTFSVRDYEGISQRLRYSRTSRSGVFVPLVTQDLYPLREYIA